MEQGSSDWLQARRSGIGGSDAATLYGQGFTTLWELWARKTGRIEPKPSDLIRDPLLWWGHRLEDDILEAYQITAGRVVGPGRTMHWHPEGLPMFANTDGEIEAAPGFEGPGIYEGKAPRFHSRREWSDADDIVHAPLKYQVQAQHYMACTGLKWASFGAYFQDHKLPVVLDFHRNDAFIADLERRVAAFWRDHVEADVPPAVQDGSKKTAEALRDAYPEDAGGVLVMPDGFKFLRDAWDQADLMIENLNAMRQSYKNTVLEHMGRFAVGVTFDGQGFTWRTNKAGVRVLRRVGEETIRRAIRKHGEPQTKMTSPTTSAALELIEATMTGRTK